MAFIKLFLLSTFIGINAYSSCISYRYRPVLWNLKGDSVIILRQGFGADNAGSVDLFVTRTNMDLTQFQVSSTVHSDGTSRSEAIRQEDCIKSLKQFNQTLVDQVFPKHLHDSTCKPERDYLFNKKVDTTSPIDEKKQSEILKNIEFKNEVSAYTSNNIHFIVTQTKANCSAECFWVEFDKAKSQYTKKGACLPNP